MATIKHLIRSSVVRRVLYAVAGSGAGYVYFLVIGCDGSCPITSQAWSSAAYGALFGILVHPSLRSRDEK